ncbi:hypothetical protein ACFYY5_29380 [Nocardia elegans]|uniref:HNH endonuclease n=1 Tax=Nocardia elegans TaxID=300029 RepID=A0ABW6TLF9_9NOCA
MTIDHINGNGAAHRRSLGKNAGSLQVWRSLIADNFPSGYQVLCWNCNVAKHIYGVCPHAA